MIDIKKLLGVLKEFYVITHKEAIDLIGNLEKKINASLLKDIENDEIKNKIDGLNKILPDLDKKAKLRESKFLKIFSRLKKQII